MMAYEKKVDDYSFGTMLRSNPTEEYTQHGTIFGKSAGHCSCSHSRSPRIRRLPALSFTPLLEFRCPCQLSPRRASHPFAVAAQVSEKHRAFDRASWLNEQMLISNSASYAVLRCGNCKKPKRTE